MTKQGSSLKRKRKAPLKGQAEFWRAVTNEGAVPCWLDVRCGRGVECDYLGQPCDAHHLIPKERIKSHFSGLLYRSNTLGGARRNWVPEAREAALGDPRNGLPVCRFHHSQLEAHRIKLSRAELPESVFVFAAEFGLEAQLDRAYPAEVEAA